MTRTKILAACRRFYGAAPTARNAGFTLIEALAATMLMVIIMGALSTITAQWLPGWDRGIAALQRTEQFALGMDRVTADLAAAQIVSGAGTTPLFDGSEQSVIFVRTRLAPSSTGGLEIVRIAQTSDERGPVLVRSTAPFLPTVTDPQELAFSNPTVVLRDSYQASFSYAGPDRVWHDTWHNMPVLPRAVRVRIRDAATSRTLTVSTSTLIHAELSAKCATRISRIAVVDSRLDSNPASGSNASSDCFGQSSAPNAADAPGAALAQ